MKKRQKMTLGLRLRQTREECGLSQTAAAGLLGVTNVYLCRLEADRDEPSLPLLRKIGKLYKLRLWELTGHLPD